MSSRSQFLSPCTFAAVRPPIIAVGPACSTASHNRWSHDSGPVVVLKTWDVRWAQRRTRRCLRTSLRETCSPVSWDCESMPACTAASSSHTAPMTGECGH